MTGDRPKITRVTGPRGESCEFIEMPNRLAQKAGSFHADPAGAARLQAQLDALSESYPDLAQPDFETMAGLWQQLRESAGGVGDNESFQRVTNFQRVIHDFKSHGGSVGYPLITEVATSLGELVRRADLAGETAKQAVDQHVAAIGMILRGRLAGDGGASGQALMSALQSLAARCLAGRAP